MLLSSFTPWVSLCQRIEKSTLTSLSGKGIYWKDVRKLTQQKGMLNSQASSDWGHSLCQGPGIRRQPLAIRCHAFVIPPRRSAQDSGSEGRSPGWPCSSCQPLSPTTSTRGRPLSAFCRSAVMCLGARLDLLEVRLHHTHPSVWPWTCCPSPCASIYCSEKWG